MGFLTKKKTIEEAHLSFYYPQDKITWGKTYKKNYFDALMTKELISNKHNGVSNTENMNSLITAMNTFHTPSFIPKQVPSLCGHAGSKRTFLDMDKALSKIPDMKEFVSSSMDDFSLGAYYYLQEKLKDKEFNPNNLTFKDSKFIYKIDDTNETYEGIDYNEPKPIVSEDMPLVPIREPLPTKEPLSKLGIYLDIENHLDNLIMKPLRAELLKQYGVSYDDKSKEVLERNFHIDFVQDNNNGTYKVEVSAEYTWNGQMFSLDEYLDYVSQGKENLRGLFEASVKARYNKETSTYPHSEEIKEKYYKFIQIMITLDIDKDFLDVYNDQTDDEKILFIKYLDNQNRLKIAMITDFKSVVTTASDIRLTARYPLKGGKLRSHKPKDESRQERLYRLALEKVGYKKKHKKRYPKKEEDSKDIIQELKGNDKVKYADIYQVINLFPMLIKENRQKIGYIKYYEAVVKYFDKLVGGFPEDTTGYIKTKTYKVSKPKHKKILENPLPNTSGTDKDNETVTRQVEGVDVKHYYSTSLPNKDRAKISCGIVGIKRYVKGEFTKKCFTGVEPNIGGMWLYVNVPDKEKKGYTQYALNMHCWFNAFNFKPRVGRIRKRKSDIQNSFPPVMLRLKDTKGWYNDGNQTINAKKFEYNSVREVSYGEKSWQKRVEGSKFIVEFEFDDRCDINYYEKYKEKLIQLHKAMPVMPIKLWQKVPYCGKKDVAHHTIVLYCFISYTIKVKRGFFKALGFFIGIGLMAMGQVWAGALTFGSNLASNLGLFDSSFGQLIQLAITVYTGYLTVANATSTLGQAISTAGTALKVTNGIMAYTQQAKINKAMNEYNSLMAMMSSNDMKELNQKLLDNMMKGINLRDYDVDVDYSSEIDLMYYIAYGGLLFNDFYDKEAYTSAYKIYSEFERFK